MRHCVGVTEQARTSWSQSPFCTISYKLSSLHASFVYIGFGLRDQDLGSALVVLTESTVGESMSVRVAYPNEEMWMDMCRVLVGSTTRCVDSYKYTHLLNSTNKSIEVRKLLRPHLRIFCLGRVLISPTWRRARGSRPVLHIFATCMTFTHGF